ncbi:MAG: YscO family type III secretion system apparatus protein [Alphaproteobacteria bacterium]
MLSELEQLLSCRRERENRAAAALCQARARLDRAEAEAEAARARLDEHHRERKTRQDKLYRDSLRTQLSKYEVDDLNIELDLMAEETEGFLRQLQGAEAALTVATKEVEAAAAVYRRHRQAGDRFGHLVDDVAERERRRREQAEEFAVEDDLGDRRVAGQEGMG